MQIQQRRNSIHSTYFSRNISVVIMPRDTVIYTLTMKGAHCLQDVWLILKSSASFKEKGDHRIIL